MTGTMKKVRNAVVAFIGIFVILAGVIAYVNHAEAIDKKSKEVALSTLQELDSEFTDENVVKVSYEYEYQNDTWYEVIEYSDGTNSWVVL